jgi:hypothetical protein
LLAETAPLAIFFEEETGRVRIVIWIPGQRATRPSNGTG